MKTNTNLPQSTLTQLEHWLSTVAIHTHKQFFAFFRVLPWDNLICLNTSLGQHNKCVWVYFIQAKARYVLSLVNSLT